jgi:excisionase family DNA binding protein
MRELTVKELAEREGVNPKTVYRWINKGALDVRRTPGGGLRIVERRSGPGAIVITARGPE